MVINTRRAVVTGINRLSSSCVISYAGTEEEGSGYWPTPPDYRLLVMLMSKTSGPNPTRNWQIVDVISSDPSNRTVTVTPFAFTNWGSISTTGSMIQIMNVPVYSDVIIDNGGSLTCDPWNEYTGGVLCFIANGKIEVLSGDNDGAFNVAGKGFKQLVVNGGAGGRGGYRSNANGTNSSIPGDKGLDAAGANANPALPLSGQGELCFDGLSNFKGGNGGLGGSPINGAFGAPGTPASTNGNLGSPSVPKLLMMGNSGKQGNGGNGGQAGGNGGNGGNGGGSGSIGALGQQGEDGGPGGKGGKGGRGGGIIITFSNELILPYPCVNIKGQDGEDGAPGEDNATFTAGKAGNGGNGGNGDFSNPQFYGYGGGGGKGLRGNGASGGNGGDGGKAGSICMRTLSTNNDFAPNKMMSLRSKGGLGGAGKAPYAIPALDGLSGCAKPFVNISGRTTDDLCITRNYDEYKCAAYEAFQVLGDMDFVEDFPGYVRFTKVTGSAVSKKSNKTISTDPKYYYCIYFKCSKLLVAYEDDDDEVNATVMQMPGCSTADQDAYRVLKGNFYWAKFTNVSCANCANIIKKLADDLKNNIYDPPTSTHSESLTINGLKHDYGTVTFGQGGKFTYTDTYPDQEIGVLSEPARNLVCLKQCGTFNKDWLIALESCPCDEPDGDEKDDGGGGWGGSSDPNPPKPQIPGSYIDEPLPGNDGTPGEDGIGGAWGGGQYNPNDEDGLHETPPVYNALEYITTSNNFVNVWPNPAYSILNLTFARYLTTANIKVMDITGKIIWERSNLGITQQNFIIDVESWNGGTYFIEVTTTQQTKTFKFIKQ